MIDVVHICVAMKPVEGNFAQNALKHGVAGMAIDASRVRANMAEMAGRSGVAVKGNQVYGKGVRNPTDGVWEPSNEGRWPANVILDGSDEVIGEFPESDHARGNIGNGKGGGGMYGHGLCMNSFGAGDSGSAARFFKQCERADDD